ncbi:MAG: hypothetical protein H6905_07260 [Hyphomicrobiales bacterium]|nr:hypothetical protein [Hyphomicrobiales bacterium]
MPMELRKIMFSLAEIQSAACSFCRAHGTPIASTDVADVSISENPNAMVVLHLRKNTPDHEPGRIVLQRDDVMETLIQHCIRLKVPLPKEGKKILWPQDDGISLMVTLVEKGQKPATVEKDGFAGAAALNQLIRRSES